MLIFPLKKEWYEKIKSGEKTVEYREVKPYWIKRICNAVQSFNYENNYKAVFFDKTDKEHLKQTFKIPMECYLQLGYNAKTRLSGLITDIRVVDGKDTDLHIDKPVYAIHLTDVREAKE